VELFNLTRNFLSNYRTSKNC